MTYLYRLNGVDCPLCASKMERAVAKIKGVQSASLIFMTQKLTVEADAQPDEDAMVSAIRKIDRNVVVSREDV